MQAHAFYIKPIMAEVPQLFDLTIKFQSSSSETKRA